MFSLSTWMFSRCQMQTNYRRASRQRTISHTDICVLHLPVGRGGRFLYSCCDRCHREHNEYCKFEQHFACGAHKYISISQTQCAYVEFVVRVWVRGAKLAKMGSAEAQNTHARENRMWLVCDCVCGGRGAMRSSPCLDREWASCCWCRSQEDSTLYSRWLFGCVSLLHRKYSNTATIICPSNNIRALTGRNETKQHRTCICKYYSIARVFVYFVRRW